MAKSRHRKAENLRRYFKPSPQAMRDLIYYSAREPTADADQRLRHIRWFFGNCYRDLCERQ